MGWKMIISGGCEDCEMAVLTHFKAVLALTFTYPGDLQPSISAAEPQPSILASEPRPFIFVVEFPTYTSAAET